MHSCLAFQATVDSSFPVLASVVPRCKEKASQEADEVRPSVPVPAPVGKASKKKASDEADEVQPPVSLINKELTAI